MDSSPKNCAVRKVQRKVLRASTKLFTSSSVSRWYKTLNYWTIPLVPVVHCVSQFTGIISAPVTNHPWVKTVEKHVIFQVLLIDSSADPEHHIRDQTQHWSYLLWAPSSTACVIHRIWHIHRREKSVQASDCTLIDSALSGLFPLGDVAWLLFLLSFKRLNPGRRKEVMEGSHLDKTITVL